MAATDTQLQQLVINVGTDAQIRAGIAGGTITEDMLSIATDGADITYDWIGTLAEYNEQDIATNHPDWLCFITDDVNKSGEDIYDNVYSKTEADEIFVAKTDGVAYLPNLLEFKWSDHILNTVSWLRADTFSWQSGELYEAAYQHLVDDIEGKTLQTETISGVTISYYLADDMHKICPANQESNVASLYTNTGVAWYFILDTTNTQFKLPRTKFGFTGLRSEVGKYVAPGLPNITGYMTNGSHSLNVGNGTVSANSALYAPGTKKGATVAGNSGSDWIGDIGFDASRSNSIYGASTTVQPSATEMYLYFYIGEFTQDAIINTAGVTTEVLNSKANIDFTNISAAGILNAVSWVMPDMNNVTTLSNISTYQQVPGDGFIWFTGTGNGSWADIGVCLSKDGVGDTCLINIPNMYGVGMMVPVSKNTYVKSYGSTSAMRFYACKK